jgi:hypothetical protein
VVYDGLEPINYLRISIMAAKPVSIVKTFTNVDEVLAKMDELGFFYGYERDLAKQKIEADGVHDSNENWFSNGYLEIKIFRRMFGAYELCNFRGIKHKQIEELFDVATQPKIA